MSLSSLIKQKCSKNETSNGFVFLLSSQESLDHGFLDVPVSREQMNRYRAAAETAQSELAALSVKYDCVQSEVHLKILPNNFPSLRILYSHFLQRIESPKLIAFDTQLLFLITFFFLEFPWDFYSTCFCVQELIMILYLKDLKHSSFLSSSKFNLF